MSTPDPDQFDVESALADQASAINTAWLIFCASLVFLMQLGFALVEAGGVRAKNVANILLKNIMDCLIGSISFWLVGYGFAFGDSTNRNTFIGDSKFALRNLGDEYALWFFQFAFCGNFSQ